MSNSNHSEEAGLQNILLKLSWASSVELLNQKEQASILKNIFNYHTGKPLVPLSKAANMLFSAMKEVFEFNRERYNRKVEANRENGKKGGRPTDKKPNNPDGLLTNPENLKEKDKAKEIERVREDDNDSDTERDILTGKIEETDPRFEKYYMQKFKQLLDVVPDSLSDRDERIYVQSANRYYRKLGADLFSKIIFHFKSQDAQFLINQYGLESNLEDFKFIRYNMIGYLRKLVK